MKACALALLFAALASGAAAGPPPRRPAPRPQPVACPAKQCFCTPTSLGATVNCDSCACTECFPATGLTDAANKALGCSKVRRRRGGTRRNERQPAARRTRQGAEEEVQPASPADRPLPAPASSQCPDNCWKCTTAAGPCTECARPGGGGPSARSLYEGAGDDHCGEPAVPEAPFYLDAEAKTCEL